MASNGGPVLVTENLTKRYGDFTALDNLSIHVDRGQILGFIGPNGAGKTTAIKILVGLSLPSSGTATIAGVDCTRDAGKIKELVGYMPDRFGAYNNMRVHEYLDFFGAAFGIKRSERKNRIAAVMEMTNSTYMQDRYVESLSHGMQQRIGIARTLIHDPEVLILDEPANGLDPQARIEMREILLRLAELGKTLIVTSHILPELSRICNHVAIVYQGKLKAFGTLDEVTSQFRQERTIEVQMTSADFVERAVEIIRETRADGHDGITASSAERIVRFRTDETEEALGQILVKLTEQKIPVSQFREIAGDLEDAFLSITKQADGAKG